jgi:hypothetical protein
MGLCHEIFDLWFFRDASDIRQKHCHTGASLIFISSASGVDDTADQQNFYELAHIFLADFLDTL